MAKIYEGPVYLEPIEHVYIHRITGKRFTSVTKVLGSIEPHFEGERIAEAIAKQADSKKKEKYIGMNKAQILDYWQELNDTANEYGTHVHETIEKYLLNHKCYWPTDEHEKRIIAGYESLNIDEGIEIYPERVMFSEEYELAGTADLKIDIDKEWFDIGDWKGLPIDTPIFTDSGWKTMGTLESGDKVYDMNGKFTNILHLSQVKNVPCYKITFDNNETIVADFEHRWLISFMRDKKFKDVVMTTEELSKYIADLPSNKRWSHKIPKVKMAKPLGNPTIDLPIDPYLLGVWLGDGHSADSKITNMHDTIWCEIEKRGYKIGNDVSQGGAGKAQTKTIFDLIGKLRNLNLIGNKHLPDIYLHGSYEQRLDVLRGFMDADGHYNKKRKRFVMQTTQLWQVEAFTKLVSSLGVKTTTIPVNKKFDGRIFEAWDVCFSTNNVNPFLCRNIEGIVYTKRNEKTYKNIIKVEPVESTPTRCIEVESKTHTFLYGHTFSITHNTNKEFNFYNAFGHKTLLKPFDHMQDCQYSIYSMQLSVYALMCEMETGMKCRQIWIGYWDKTSDVFSKIPVMYLKSEAKKLLEYHKLTQLSK